MPYTSAFKDAEKETPDLSYLSAEPPPAFTTQEMPVALATAANRNLATEDASIARINTILGRNPTPAVGAPAPTGNVNG